MKQPTAKVKKKDILRIIKRDFPHDDLEDILGILNLYGSEEFENDPYRVQAAALKISEGDIKKLKKAIDDAKCDYRDVLMDAEYPLCKKKMFKDLDKKEKNIVYKSDWDQYKLWFKK